MEMIINTVRMVDNDQAKEYFFGNEETLKNKLAIGLFNTLDFKNLNISSDMNIRVTSNFGKVVIKPIENENVPIGTIVMPVSIWANQITGIEQNEINFKNIKVKVETCRDPILNLDDLIISMKE
ncbi:MAG: molybdopterin dinucleotide binding domain-containing protein [Promethearchaeota archaeon]